MRRQPAGYLGLFRVGLFSLYTDILSVIPKGALVQMSQDTSSPAAIYGVKDKNSGEKMSVLSLFVVSATRITDSSLLRCAYYNENLARPACSQEGGRRGDKRITSTRAHHFCTVDSKACSLVVFTAGEPPPAAAGATSPAAAAAATDNFPEGRRESAIMIGSSIRNVVRPWCSRRKLATR